MSRTPPATTVAPVCCEPDSAGCVPDADGRVSAGGLKNPARLDCLGPLGCLAFVDDEEPLSRLESEDSGGGAAERFGAGFGVGDGLSALFPVKTVVVWAELDGLG